MKTKQLISLAFRIVIALIFVQTLYFKFTGHPESVYIFSQLGLEPYGRVSLGFAELVASILLFVPKTKIFAIFMTLGIISGAIMSHLLVIGTEIKGDSGGLFTLALVVLVASISLLFIHLDEVKSFVFKILRR